MAPPAPAVPAAPAAKANTSPAALNGIWKFNKELSTDTTKLQTEADNAAANSGDTGKRRGGGGSGGFGGFGGRGGGGGGKGGGMNSTDAQKALQTRALMREMADAPVQLTLVVADETTTMTDDQGVVRKFTTNGKKETIDLGTAHVDGVSSWDGGTLTVELTGGAYKLTETYQLTVQGHALVEELKGGNTSSNRGGNSAQSAVPVKRIFDKADAGGY